MRVGFNPHKDKIQETGDYFHQVILPVYIPSFEGYFKDSFEILKLCLESLFQSSHKKTYITIVNNGSCKEVTVYLERLLSENKIQELINTTNIGKINAVLKGLAGVRVPLITISDADVMFLTGWQEATYNVFRSFPKAGVVCPTPSSKSYKTFTSNIYWDLFWSKKLRFTPVKNRAALEAFAHSIGNEEFYKEYHLKQFLTVSSSEGTKAVVGAGHFIATYREEVFAGKLPKFTRYRLGGTSEQEVLDLPPVKRGFWRLSTEDNYACHLGNVVEPWMKEKLLSVKKNATPSEAPALLERKASRLEYYLKIKLFAKIIFAKKILSKILWMKGLPKDVSEKY